MVLEKILERPDVTALDGTGEAIPLPDASADLVTFAQSWHWVDPQAGVQSPSGVILEPKKIKSDTVSTVSPSICHEVMGPDAMIFVF